MEITVSDPGQGIAPELLLHVFERFRQSDSSSTRRHGGLGLGLAIVRQLVEIHGGTVTAESTGEGAGTIFKVILPLMSVHHEPNDGELTDNMIGSKTLTGWQPSLTGLRVLVVDDEPDSQELIEVVLSGRGAEVVTACVGVEYGMRARSAGYQRHISKPVEPLELATVVANLAGRSAET
ncbi:MAG: hypothetical protein QOH25_469 [Acidobacteriota bacterium]|jgi:hypothetical protein|nr:hypothetical protein [Acidobacteriota bacterium]